MNAIWRALLTAGLLLAASEGRAEEGQVARAKALFERAEVHYRLEQFAAALVAYREALKLAPRPNLLFNIAQCHRRLKNHEAAIFNYNLYLSDWQRLHPSEAAPFDDEVQQHIAALEQASRAEAAARASARPPQPRREPVEEPRRRSRTWLALSVTGTGLAVAAELAALVLTARVADTFNDEPGFGALRDGAIAGHVLAGSFAVASVVAWILYARSGKGAPRSRLTATPTGGAVSFRF